MVEYLNKYPALVLLSFFRRLYTTHIYAGKMVQGTGFEPAKHYALGPKPSPFDHSGTPAYSGRLEYTSRIQRKANLTP